jgi:hypothetical protein
MKRIMDVEQPEKNLVKVSVTEIDIPMRCMAVFMVKWAIASIPALLIILFLVLLFFYVFVARFFCPI